MMKSRTEAQDESSLTDFLVDRIRPDQCPRCRRKSTGDSGSDLFSLLTHSKTGFEFKSIHQDESTRKDCDYSPDYPELAFFDGDDPLSELPGRIEKSLNLFHLTSVSHNPSVLESRKLIAETLGLIFVPDFVPMAIWYGTCLEDSEEPQIPWADAESNVLQLEDVEELDREDTDGEEAAFPRRGNLFFSQLMEAHPRRRDLKQAVLSAFGPSFSDVVPIDLTNHSFWARFLDDNIGHLHQGAWFLARQASALLFRQILCEKQQSFVVVLLLVPYDYKTATRLRESISESFFGELDWSIACRHCHPGSAAMKRPALLEQASLNEQGDFSIDEARSAVAKEFVKYVDTELVKRALLGPSILHFAGKTTTSHTQLDPEQVWLTVARRHSHPEEISGEMPFRLRLWISEATKAMFEDDASKRRHLNTLLNKDHPARGVLPQVARTGIAQLVPHAVIDPRVRSYRKVPGEDEAYDEAESAIYTSKYVDYFAAPLIVLDRFWGVFQFFWRRPEERSLETAKSYHESALKLVWLTYRIRRNLETTERADFVEGVIKRIRDEGVEKVTSLPRKLPTSFDRTSELAEWLQHILYDQQQVSVFPDVKAQSRTEEEVRKTIGGKNSSYVRVEHLENRPDTPLKERDVKGVYIWIEDESVGRYGLVKDYVSALRVLATGVSLAFARWEQSILQAREEVMGTLLRRLRHAIAAPLRSAVGRFRAFAEPDVKDRDIKGDDFAFANALLERLQMTMDSLDVFLRRSGVKRTEDSNERPLRYTNLAEFLAGLNDDPRTRYEDSVNKVSCAPRPWPEELAGVDAYGDGKTWRLLLWLLLDNAFRYAGECRSRSEVAIWADLQDDGCMTLTIENPVSQSTDHPERFSETRVREVNAVLSNAEKAFVSPDEYSIESTGLGIGHAAELLREIGAEARVTCTGDVWRVHITGIATNAK